MKISVRVRIDGRDLERDYCYTKEDISNSAYLGSMQVLMEDALKYSEEQQTHDIEEDCNPF